MAALALALVPPGAASPTPVGTFTWIASGPGNQTDPAIDGRYVLYADDSRGSFDVLARDLVTGTTRAVASGPGPEDSPDLAPSVVAYRSPAGVTVRTSPRVRCCESPTSWRARAGGVHLRGGMEVGREDRGTSAGIRSSAAGRRGVGSSTRRAISAGPR
jgi:hypothetical protein